MFLCARVSRRCFVTRAVCLQVMAVPQRTGVVRRLRVIGLWLRMGLRLSITVTAIMRIIFLWYIASFMTKLLASRATTITISITGGLSAKLSILRSQCDPSVFRRPILDNGLLKVAPSSNVKSKKSLDMQTKTQNHQWTDLAHVCFRLCFSHREHGMFNNA